MGLNHTKTRRHGKVYELPEDVRIQVEDLLLEPNVTYDDIAEFLKDKGQDVSRSAIGRYGKDFLNEYRNLRIIEDQAKNIVSGSGDDAMVLEEAATKLFSKKIVELLLENGINLNKIPRIVSDFARLQASSVLRERLKADFRKKTEKAVKSIANKLRKDVSPENIKYIKEVLYGLSA